MLLNVRKVQEQLLDLQRRGFGDNAVMIEIGGAGSVTEVKVVDGRVWLITSAEA
jgi:hypothetical protein